MKFVQFFCSEAGMCVSCMEKEGKAFVEISVQFKVVFFFWIANVLCLHISLPEVKS